MKTTLHILLLILLFTAIAVTAAPASAYSTSNSLGEKVDAYIKETMDRLPIPGLAVGIVKGDQVLYLQGYGTANADGEPVTPQTPFMLASVTKTFTALAVQQLAAAGKIDLDKPLQTYLPEFQLADEQAAATITVRHLLDHTSGISTIEGTQPYLQSPNVTVEDALKKLARYHLKHTPGEQYEYSNWNYVLLGEVIARASGEPYTEYMQKYVLDPLEMTRSTFADPHTIPGIATGNLMAFGVSVPYDEPYIPSTLSAGYLTSTAEEMTHYLVTFFNHGQFNGQDLLPSQGLGWYDTSWNWHMGMPDDISYGFSGGHNSINTNIQLFSFHRVGVVVLMNTRFDQLIPGPMANDIAFNIARITIGSSYEVPSASTLYIGYALLDVVLLLMIISIIWQAYTFKKWTRQYRSATRSKRIAAWIGISFDLLIFIAALLFPSMVDTRWNIVLHFRPDLAIPLLIIGLSMGTLGLMKIARSTNIAR